MLTMLLNINEFHINKNVKIASGKQSLYELLGNSIKYFLAKGRLWNFMSGHIARFSRLSLAHTISV